MADQEHGLDSETSLQETGQQAADWILDYSRLVKGIDAGDPVVEGSPRANDALYRPLPGAIALVERGSQGSLVLE